LQDSFIVKGTPSQIRWSPNSQQRICTAIIGDKHIVHVDADTLKNTMISFSPQYGKVTTYKWFTDQFLVVGHSTGVVTLISLNPNEIGMEKNSINAGSVPIECISVNADVQKLCVGAMGSVKFFSLEDWSEIVTERLEITQNAGKINDIHWTPDGSIMTLSTSGGYFFGFLTVIPCLYSAFDNFAGLLSSLTEISVVDCARQNMLVSKTDLDIEPQFLTMGPLHFAVGANNNIWYYRWRTDYGEITSL